MTKEVDVPMPTRSTLPPGQRRIERFPRFGEHMSKPPPAVPADPVIAVRGAVTDAFEVPLDQLTRLPRQELVADFHCVAGWTTTNLRWEGVPFEAFYRGIIAPALAEGTTVTHLVFAGLDGYRSVATIEDALADGVLIAEHLNREPLDADHGAPVRLLSPNQYGYISTKHLCAIEVHTTEPPDPTASRLAKLLVKSHPRARVWEEERHGFVPAWLIRPLYRAAKSLLLRLSARGELKNGLR